jgi:uncharacterized protein YjbI with pentapeptide repeats
MIKPYLGQAGIIQMTGPTGSGKSVALDYLLATLPPGSFVAIDNALIDMRDAPADKLVVATNSLPLRCECLATFAMSGWTFDDCTLYLSRVHPAQCRSVIDRLMMDETTPLLEGTPRLIRIALDAMANDPSIETCSMALRKHLANRIPPDHRRGLAVLCLRSALKEKGGIELDQLQALDDPHVVNLLRHHTIRVLLAADRVAEKLADSQPTEELSETMPLELVKEIAFSARTRPKAIERLNAFLMSTDRRFDAMAASILLAVDPGWRPQSGQNLQLMEGYFADAKWRGIDLAGANLSGADFSQADLRDADLTNVLALGTIFITANFENSILTYGNFMSSDLTLASFLCCSGRYSIFDRATLEAANLQYSDFSHAAFHSARLTLASFARSALNFAKFSANDVQDADFDEAQLMGSRFKHVRLRDATFVGACFQGAIVRNCNLEGMHLPDANFFEADLTGSDFTGTRIPGGNFHGAKLANAGLAEIDWPGADLHGADLRGASFHMGSSRSGLVGSTIPCEGSRTGFYTDDYNDQDFKDPEEIRKANLRNADLRYADVEKTDFYLVDLRGAKLSPGHVEHFKRTGAILQRGPQ